MAQTRLFNFGDPVTAERIGYMIDAEYIAQVVEGFDMTATDVDEVTISPGKAVVVGVPSGLLHDTARFIIEDAIDVLHISNTSAAKNFTIMYVHEDSQLSGGIAAILTAVDGLYTSYQDAVILGWIVYPGGGVPLEDDMLYMAPKLDRTDRILRRLSDSDVRHPPFWGLFEVAIDPAITVTVEASVNGYLRYKLACSPLALGVRQATWKVQHSIIDDGINVIPPKEVVVAAKVPAAPNSLVLSIYDSAAALFDSTTIANVAWGDHEWRASRDYATATFDIDGVFITEWSFGLEANQFAYWGRFAVSSVRDLPFDVGYTNAGP